MEIRTKKIGTNIWQFVNESWSTSNLWGHRTIVLKNGSEYIEHKTRYYNRTWENYTYQTCMYNAIRELYQQQEDRFIDNYKYENNIDRFKKGQKEEIIKLFVKSDIAKELKKLIKTINENKFTF